MAIQRYRALRIVLGVFSVLVLVGSLLMILGSKSLMMRVLMRPPESEVSTLLLFIIREMGGFVLMLSALLFFASRDPVRNVAIIDAVIVGLCVLAVTPLHFTCHIGPPEILSWVLGLGSLYRSVSDSSVALLPAAARGVPRVRSQIAVD